MSSVSALYRLLQVLGYIVLVFILTFMINSLIKVTAFLSCTADVYLAESFVDLYVNVQHINVYETHIRYFQGFCSFSLLSRP